MTETGTKDISIRQGETWTMHLALTDDDDNIIDLTGYTIDMYIKKDYNSYIIESLTIANGKIIDTSFNLGIVDLKLTPDDTRHFNFDCGIYDMRFLDPSGNTTYILAGKVTISKSVTL